MQMGRTDVRARVETRPVGNGSDPAPWMSQAKAGLKNPLNNGDCKERIESPPERHVILRNEMAQINPITLCYFENI